MAENMVYYQEVAVLLTQIADMLVEPAVWYNILSGYSGNKKVEKCHCKQVAADCRSCQHALVDWLMLLCILLST